MANCLLALGSNLGDRHHLLQKAIEQLGQHAAIDVLAVSRFYETEPAGGPAGQDSFLNAAAVVQTSLNPQQLLSATQAVEKLLGRARVEHWGPRAIDVDLLIYDDVICTSDQLSLPHPWMVARRFVLEPAAEIAPTMVHPELGWTVERLLQHLQETPNRFAVEGLASLGLGQRICQQVAATLVKDPASQAAQDRYSVLESSQQLELAKRRSQCLSAANWGHPDAFTVSEFWFAASAVIARGTLTGSELAAFEACFDQWVATLPAPKLLILCRAGQPNTAQTFPWAALREWVSGHNEYPWLEIRVLSEDQVTDQIAAALTSMQ